MPNQYLNQQRNFAQQGRQRPRRPQKQFNPGPMSYGILLPLLLNNSLVQLREAKAPPTLPPPDYDANSRCVFHSGAPGHSIEDCKSSKSYCVHTARPEHGEHSHASTRGHICNVITSASGIGIDWKSMHLREEFEKGLLEDCHTICCQPNISNLRI